MTDASGIQIHLISNEELKTRKKENPLHVSPQSCTIGNCVYIGVSDQENNWLELFDAIDKATGTGEQVELILHNHKGPVQFPERFRGRIKVLKNSTTVSPEFYAESEDERAGSILGEQAHAAAPYRSEVTFLPSQRNKEPETDRQIQWGPSTSTPYDETLMRKAKAKTKHSPLNPLKAATTRFQKMSPLRHDSSSDSSSEEDRILPTRGRIRQKNARPSSKDRKTSAHVDARFIKAGNRRVTIPEGFKIQLKKVEGATRSEQKENADMIYLATASTADEILERTDINQKAKLDMVCELADALQALISGMIWSGLTEDENASSKYNPKLGTVHKMRKHFAKSGSQESRGRQAGAESRKRQDTPLPSDSSETESSEATDSSDEEYSVRKSIMLAGKENKKTKNSQAVSELKERALYPLSQLSFPAEATIMDKAQEIVRMGELYKADDDLIEAMIVHHTRKRIAPATVRLQLGTILGKSPEDERNDRAELIRAIGVYPYCLDRQGKVESVYALIRELQEVTDLVPGLAEAKLLGPETTWIELSNFAIRWERKRKLISEKQRIQPPRAAAQRAQRAPPARKSRQQRQRAEAPVTERHQKSMQEKPKSRNKFQKSDFKQKPAESDYVSKENWERMTPEQRQDLIDKRNKKKQSKSKNKTREVRHERVVNSNRKESRNREE